jgi:hypothetical protein
MNWLNAIIGPALAALIITATVLMMRRREKMRAAGREAESLNVLSDDTRRAIWIAAADHFDASDSAASGAGDSGGGDGGGDSE